MKRFTREVHKLIHAFEIIEDLVRVLAELAVARVEVGQDAGAASVQPVAWVGGCMTGGQAVGDGAGGVDIVGGICCVWEVLVCILMLCHTPLRCEVASGEGGRKVPLCQSSLPRVSLMTRQGTGCRAYPDC
jgi:hypothetical protein